MLDDAPADALTTLLRSSTQSMRALMFESFDLWLLLCFCSCWLACGCCCCCCCSDMNEIVSDVKRILVEIDFIDLWSGSPAPPLMILDADADAAVVSLKKANNIQIEN